MQYRIHFDAERAFIGGGAAPLMNGHHAGAGCPVGEPAISASGELSF